MSDSEKPANPSSRWSVIRRAQGSGPEAKRALHELVQYYQGYILRLIRCFRHPPDLAPDELKDDFVLGILEGGLDKLSGERSFHAWICWQVRAFLSEHWRKYRLRARERAMRFDLISDADAERFAEAAFAWELLLKVLERLRGEAADPQRFEVLRRFLPGPAQDLTPYAPVAQELGITPTHLAKLVHDLRADLKQALRDALADLVDPDPDDPDPIDREMRLLYRSLSESPNVGVLLEES